MAKARKKSVARFAASAGDHAEKRVIKGKLSPVKAAKDKHAPAAVLGKRDSAYHNC